MARNKTLVTNVTNINNRFCGANLSSKKKQLVCKMTENKMRLRSSISHEEREYKKAQIVKEKEERENRPFLKYGGKIKYYTTFIDCAQICDNILNSVKNAQEPLVLGFDLEWPFNFQTGSGKTALMQISPSLDICYLFHVSMLKVLPKSVSELLQHPNTRITGVNIKNDVRKLARDFPGFNGDKMVENCIDSGVLANSILPCQQRWSMEKLVNYCLKKRINKDKKVRMSKWHIIPLSGPQKIYAATDAYASLLLYQHLKALEKVDEIEI